MWGELILASCKRFFNPPSQFSRLGIFVSSSVLQILQIKKWNIGMAQKEGRQDGDGLYTYTHSARINSQPV